MHIRVFDKDYSVAKAHFAGTHRSRSPSETLEKFLPHAPLVGLTRLANVTGLDCVGIPVFQGVRPNAKNLSLSQGKGLTADAAKASALMEAIEGWHAEEVILERKEASWIELVHSANVAPVERLMRLKPAAGADFENLRQPWIEGFDIVQQSRVWVPEELVCLDRTRPIGGGYFLRNSCGMGSGNHILEAICHALLEVIEHDAHTLWHENSKDPDGIEGLVDLDSINDPAARTVLDKMHAAGLYVGVHNITSDLGISVFQCLAIDSPHSPCLVGQSWGQGCHLSPHVALLRAMTEAVQARLTYIAGSRDDLTYENYKELGARSTAEGLRETLHAAPKQRQFSEAKDLASPTFEGDLHQMIETLKAAGCDQVIVVDLTHPEIGIPVVKVIVPGLEGVHGECLMGTRAQAVKAS